MNRAEAIRTMNTYGRNKEPFLFVIDYEMQHIRVWTADALPDDVSMSINGRGFNHDTIISDIIPTISPTPPNVEKYSSMFQKMMYHLGRGDTYLINLTLPISLDVEGELQDIYAYTDAKYKLYIHDHCVVFSPETFVKSRDGYLYTCPMKGTIDASLPDAKGQLLHDLKESSEHYTIVDLLRNDLSMVCSDVEVVRFKYLDRIESTERDLYQMSSEIRGKLPNNYTDNIGDILFRLLPAGSISGAPKKKTLEIIDDVENDERGYYTGIMGHFDGHDLDTGVMIRFIEKRNDSYYYRTGGGITYMSTVESEYQELLNKIYLPR